jgi:hypothetical protein
VSLAGEAITALSVQHSDQAPSGDGWKKIEVNLNKAQGKLTYIYYKKDNGSPIVDLKITTSDDQVTGPGFSKVAEELVNFPSTWSFVHFAFSFPLLFSMMKLLVAPV